MQRILFVCHGNICRSPTAEFIFKDLMRRKGLEHQFEVASAATSSEELGNPVYPPARRELLRHGIDPSGKTARQLTREDYHRYDWLIGMDGANLRNMLRICGGDPAGKIHRLLEHDIADPWYTGDFAQAFSEIEKGCEAWMARLTMQRKDAT